jgi:hypothetical protein
MTFTLPYSEKELPKQLFINGEVRLTSMGQEHCVNCWLT